MMVLVGKGPFSERLWEIDGVIVAGLFDCCLFRFGLDICW